MSEYCNDQPGLRSCNMLVIGMRVTLDGWWGKSDRRVSADETKKTRRERERDGEKEWWHAGARDREGREKKASCALLFSQGLGTAQTTRKALVCVKLKGHPHHQPTLLTPR